MLLLNYRNDPYQQVYDTIKIVDESNVIGVMHMGEFPNGVEVATFVMERYSYSFDDMSIEDHQTIFSRPDLSSPAASQLAGEWSGNFIFLEHPNTALMQHKPRIPLRLAVRSNGAYQTIHRAGKCRDPRSVYDDRLRPRF